MARRGRGSYAYARELFKKSRSWRGIYGSREFQTLRVALEILSKSTFVDNQIKAEAIEILLEIDRYEIERFSDRWRQFLRQLGEAA